MTGRDDAPTDGPFVWRGILDPDLLFDDDVSAGHELADAAKVGDWPTVFDLLDDVELHVDINWWRPGGTTWFTVLHHAAWHCAPNEVAAELIRRGALKSLTDARGRPPTTSGANGISRRAIPKILRHNSASRWFCAHAI